MDSNDILVFGLLFWVARIFLVSLKLNNMMDIISLECSCIWFSC